MKSLGLVLALCGVAVLIGAPGTTRAFELESSGDPLDTNSLFAQQHSLMQDPTAHSLAMPLSGKSESDEFISDYGNSIPIPGPGVDLPAPAWAYSPKVR